MEGDRVAESIDIMTQRRKGDMEQQRESISTDPEHLRQSLLLRINNVNQMSALSKEFQKGFDDIHARLTRKIEC